jgi:hypothetical protein
MEMFLGKSALFVLSNGTTCCVASHKASQKARLNVTFRPCFMKCYRITEMLMSRVALLACLLCSMFNEHSMNSP